MCPFLLYLEVRVATEEEDESLSWNEGRRQKEDGKGEWREGKRKEGDDRAGKIRRAKQLPCPSCTPRGTFLPHEMWEGEPPLEVCELPPIECVGARTPARVLPALTRVDIYARPNVYTYAYTSIFFVLQANIIVLPRDEGRSLYTNSMRKTRQETDRWMFHLRVFYSISLSLWVMIKF